MTWTTARLGGRFSLLLEPYRRRVMHSALGRFLDAPLDLQVGLYEPDGTLRVLPFTRETATAEGKPIRDLYNPEQFERINSITYRGYSEAYRLRFEFNIHSVFWPQHDRLCLMPAFYLEMRVSPVARVRWHRPARQLPSTVRLQLRLGRRDATIDASLDGYRGDPGAESLSEDPDASPALPQLAFSYPCPLVMDRSALHEEPPRPDDAPTVTAHERIVSLNPKCELTADGRGLIHEMPVTEAGSGTKWRLIWASHVAEPVMSLCDGPGQEPTRVPLRYTRFWDSVEAVVAEAVATRDDRLARSRQFEKVIEQAPLDRAQAHLLHLSFQSFLSNTWWTAPRDGAPPDDEGSFLVSEGASGYLSTLDVEYNHALLYLSLWPGLLKMQLEQWATRTRKHPPSGGAYPDHDLGFGTEATGPMYHHTMELEESANYLLLMQAYTRWTGDTAPARWHAELIEDLGRYLIWTDRDGSGFPSEGGANTIDDAAPALRLARKQTYLAIKRLCALRAVADLGPVTDRPELAKRCESLAEHDAPLIEAEAWLGDHYATCVDRSAAGLIDPNTGEPARQFEIVGWDAYCIYTTNGLLLPMILGQPPLLDEQHLRRDLMAGDRENQGRYADAHTSDDIDNCRISQNLWRDMTARYLGLQGPSSAGQYWDMQVMSNTGEQSLGYVDTYIHNSLAFYPRGVVTFGYFLASPRLMIDRLAPGGSYITVEPHTGSPQRWPLLPLANWHAGRVPVCVVDLDGKVSIEAETDPVIIHGPGNEKASSPAADMIG